MISKSSIGWIKLKGHYIRISSITSVRRLYSTTEIEVVTARDVYTIGNATSEMFDSLMHALDINQDTVILEL